MGTNEITVVGGGLAGLVAAISCAEAGAPVRLVEAHRLLGGRARTTDAPFRANLGPHALYDDGPLWTWLRERGLAGDEPRSPMRGLRFRFEGELRRTPPATLLRLATLLRRQAPVDRDFRAWVTERCGPAAAEAASMAAGVFTFDADPGRLSAAFLWDRLRRVVNQVPPKARYVVGGWGALVDGLAARARALGVRIEVGTPVTSLPAAPVIVATDLPAARRLLGDDSLRWEGARTALLDVGLVATHGDPFVVSDLDEAGWVERFSAPDPSLAPPGHSLLQAQVGLRAGETLGDGIGRIERILDLAFAGWRTRETWRRRSVVDGRSGALDVPGTTWRDRPAIARGDGVFLAGDMVAAPGMLSEVSFNSALEASCLALAAQSGGATSIATSASTGRSVSAGNR
ncbi:MAG: oxidoreductase [Acidimicrobiales bacterium]|nr:oxidoreductase [Acidimicrobiales bacterium]